MKKKTIWGLFSLLAVLTAIIAACSSNSSPSSPSGPANTATFTSTATFSYTPCMNSSQTPCTNTPTPTPTDTASNSPTSTPSNTATDSPTKTPTNTATDSPTNTATDTPCGFPGPACTNTPTPIFTNTFTPSPSPTPTNTVCVSNTATRTYTPSGNSLSGGLTYTGTGAVNASHPIGIYFSDSIGGGGSATYARYNKFNTASGNTYSFTGMAAGNYQAILIYDASGALASVPAQGNLSNGPWVGDMYTFYNGASGGCAPPASNNIAVSGSTILNLSFSNSCTFIGAYGNINYTGSKGTVSSCNNLYIVAYTTASYDGATGVDNNAQLNSNNIRYDCVHNGSPSTLYLQAWYDVNGNSYGSCANGSPCPHTGDPVTQLGAYTPSASYNVNITLTDTHLHP